MSRAAGRLLGYTLGYLFVVALGRIQDAVDRQAAEVEEERERVRLWLELQPPTTRPRQRCLCSFCQQSRTA